MKLFLTLALFFIGSQAQILYVDSSASSNGNGGSWNTAFNELSDALDSAWLGITQV